MKRRVKQALSLCMAAGLLLTAGGMSTVAAEEVLPEETEETEAEQETEKSLIGELVFAQCEDFINIRSAADADAEVTAKIFNNGSAEVVDEEDGWLKITSGSAEGYAKADYFVYGEEAKAIAEEVAYNVARIQVDELVVRLEPSTESEAIASVYQDEEIEVVLYGDDWMKVALDADTYGYIQASYVEYITYYPTAKTLAELEAEETVEEDICEEDLYEEELSEEESYENDSYEENIYVEETYVYETEAAVTETEAATEIDDDEANVYYADTSSIEYDFYYDADEGVYVTIENGEITTLSDTSASDNESASEDEDVVFFEDPDEYYGTSEETETEAEKTETKSTSTSTASTTSDASVGESIVSYASEFLGNSYVYGGTSLTDGCDCSGFVQSVYANFDIEVSRTAEDQASSGTVVDTDDLQEGDLLFYSSDGETIDHVAIYTGDNTIIHAANEDRGIVTDYADYDTIVSAVRYY